MSCIVAEKEGLVKVLTKRNARVFLANVLTLLVGEEHVGGETALRGIRV